MRRIIILALPLALLLSSCRMQIGTGLSNGSGSPTSLFVPTSTQIVFDTPLPTSTPAPVGTSTSTPQPDLSVVGLPTEAAGSTALDFVASMCDAQWFTQLGNLPCPGKSTQTDTGYVMRLGGTEQGLPSNFNVLLAFPPQKTVDTISSKYPAFTVQKGDRFRAVLACRAHSFCDVDFVLSYYDTQSVNGVKHWQYLFTQDPIVVDYSLDGLAGKTVQFDLAVRVLGNGLDANAVWIAPHIYRPAR
jgi:hypothetical protein